MRVREIKWKQRATIRRSGWNTWTCRLPRQIWPSFLTHRLDMQNLMMQLIESWVRCRPGSNAKHGKRFTEAMYHWAITLQYIGGNKLLKLMAENLACPTKRSIARRLAFHNPLELHKVQECVKNALASLSPSALIREGARGTV